MPSRKNEGKRLFITEAVFTIVQVVVDSVLIAKSVSWFASQAIGNCQLISANESMNNKAYDEADQKHWCFRRPPSEGQYFPSLFRLLKYCKKKVLDLLKL
jgi:hypothetical protein